MKNAVKTRKMSLVKTDAALLNYNNNNKLPSMKWWTIRFKWQIKGGGAHRKKKKQCFITPFETCPLFARLVYYAADLAYSWEHDEGSISISFPVVVSLSFFVSSRFSGIINIQTALRLSLGEAGIIEAIISPLTKGKYCRILCMRSWTIEVDQER